KERKEEKKNTAFFKKKFKIFIFNTRPHTPTHTHAVGKKKKKACFPITKSCSLTLLSQSFGCLVSLMQN
ncbi:hypothetical protein PJP07_31350, partial [Mycobacterium kansasii]